jgi:hypothetical protein
VPGCICENKEEFCGDGAMPWEDMQEGVPVQIFGQANSTVDTSAYYLFRYFHAEKCKAVRISTFKSLFISQQIILILKDINGAIPRIFHIADHHERACRCLYWRTTK